MMHLDFYNKLDTRARAAAARGCKFRARASVRRCIVKGVLREHRDAARTQTIGLRVRWVGEAQCPHAKCTGRN